MIGVEIIINMDRNKRYEFMQTFERLTRPENREDRCLEQGLFEQIGWGNQLLWMERWTTQEALDERLNSDTYKTIMGAVEVLGQVEDLRIVAFPSSQTMTAEPNHTKSLELEN